MTDLSIIVPSRNEMFLARTVADILEHREADTEIIVVLDGSWAEPGIPDHERVTLVYHNQSIGQRAAQNEAARMARGKYIMKVDAHCAFDQGFDRKMLEYMQDDWTMAPAMRNLHVFDWVCEQGHRRYQGPTQKRDGDETNSYCKECGAVEHRDVVWIPKRNPTSTAYRFDLALHFQYHGEWKAKQGKLGESMSLQGSCFMLTRQKYFELNVCDERHGSWGQQGVEVACATWLSGGKVIVNRHTWYAHLFRTQGGDFSFPYHQSATQIEEARRFSKELWLENKHVKQVRPLAWLIDRFKPLPDWHSPDGAEMLKQVQDAGQRFETSAQTPSKGIAYYTDNQLPADIMLACQTQLKKAGLPIVVSSLHDRLDFGDKVIRFPSLKRGYLAMFKQILGALENSAAEVMFLCEHDVLYHPSHFDFTPPERDVFYYNTNVWKVDYATGRALHYDCQQVSGLCAYRSLLIEHYRKRVALVEKNGFTRAMGFEPGTHNRKERVDDYKAASWQSAVPNLDIRHKENLTESRWSKDQFRNAQSITGWIEADDVPGWGRTTGHLNAILKGIHDDAGADSHPQQV